MDRRNLDRQVQLVEHGFVDHVLGNFALEQGYDIAGGDQRHALAGGRGLGARVRQGQYQRMAHQLELAALGRFAGLAVESGAGEMA